MNLYDKARQEIKKAIINAYDDAMIKGDLMDIELPSFDVNEPRDSSHGDFAANFAMIWAKPMGQNPRKIAEIIIDNIEKGGYIEKIDIAGPGFVNFTLSKEYESDVLKCIYDMGENYGKTDVFNGKKVNVEFVSANPTGPMHLGNARGGVIGDVIAGVYENCGADVTREYYVNDAGNQVEMLARSLESRYFEIHGDTTTYPFPENGYHGDDIMVNAKKFTEVHGDVYLSKGEEERRFALKEFGLKENIAKIKSDLKKYNIEYDVFFSENSLYESGEVEATLKLLDDNGYLYESEGALWFKATDFGCEKDDCLRKSNGFNTYYAADIAYHKNKFLTRNFDLCIDVLGADHHGHTVRFKGAMEAIGIEVSRLKFVLMQLVKLTENGEVVRMSKRSGKAVSLSDLLDEVPIDAARFFFCSRQAESQMEFDMALAVKEDSDNPVYYAQYAHARICSVIKNLEAQGTHAPKEAMVSRLCNKEEVALIKLLARYPEENVQAAKSFDPSKITRYILEVAAAFHTFYSTNRVNTDDVELTQSRLTLCVATRQVIACAMNLIKVSCPEKM